MAENLASPNTAAGPFGGGPLCGPPDMGGEPVVGGVQGHDDGDAEGSIGTTGSDKTIEQNKAATRRKIM